MFGLRIEGSAVHQYILPMKETLNVQDLYKTLVEEVSRLPDHSPEEIESAAHHLEMLHYQNLLESVDRNFIRYKKEDILRKLKEIAIADIANLKANSTVVEEWENSNVTPEENRARRMRFVCREYKKLCALRSNQPEAWDEINELYYDD
ncbi:MAG: hypothetical protein N2442_14475 [Spirochaetes bacterium]|nr:hypothetical protein [Spirochaetota bacterium]